MRSAILVMASPQRARGALSALCREPAACPAAPDDGHPPITGRGPGREEAAARLAIDRADRTISLVNGVGLSMRVSRMLHTLAIQHWDLALFVGFLRHCKVLPKGQKHSLGEIETIHKCAFIARAFGLDLGYEWHLYEYGVFSSFLAADHVELVDGKMQVDIGEIVELQAMPGYLGLVEGMKDGMPLPSAPFEADRFVSLVSGRDREWLSVASSIVHEKGSCPDGLLPAYVSRINADCDEKTARRVMKEIESSRPPAWEAGSAEGGNGA